jgi:hypothetical protein
METTKEDEQERRLTWRVEQEVTAFPPSEEVPLEHGEQELSPLLAT